MKVEEAVSLFKKGFRCSQAILSTYGTSFGLSQDIALKLSSPFGAGMGRLGNTCGAVTSAFMVIVLKYGNTRGSEDEKKEKAYGATKEFVDKFISQNGTLICKELLDCDISTPEGRNKATIENLFINLCPKFVQGSAEILEQLLKE